MALLIMEFAGLHILHWLLSALLPLILAGLAIGFLLVSRHLVHQAVQIIDPLVRQLDDLEGRTLEHLPAISAYFQRSRSKAFYQGFMRMEQACQELYQGRWLPDPVKWLRQDLLLTQVQQNSLSFRPAAGLLATAILGSLVSLLVQNQIPPPTAGLGLALILLPLLVGLAGALLVAANAQQAARTIQSRLGSLYFSLESHLPIFNDQAGMALLIDTFIVYDRQMKSTLQNFTATASRLAESDMADGIRRSVEQVLLESVAPSIQQATTTLNSLAGELTNRQERGMQDLAVRFATALSEDLASHLQPVNKEIAQMGALMVDVKNYIEYAMRALETVRQQSEGLLGDTRQTILQMAEARTAMSEDFSRVDEQITSLTASTSQLANLYQGNEQNLAQNLEQLGHQLDQYSQRLGSLVHESIEAMQGARQIAAGQQDSAEKHLASMQDQINHLHSQLGTDIQSLLDQVKKETEAVAAHSSSIGQQLGALNSTLNHSMDEFTQASAQYVHRTLTSFDTGLAELADRLAHTATEIRDAVDALPAALRQGPGARFDG